MPVLKKGEVKRARPIQRPVERIFAQGLALAVLASHVFFPYRAEAAFWAERRQAVQRKRENNLFASLPRATFLGGAFPSTGVTVGVPLDTTGDLKKLKGDIREILADIPFSIGTVRRITPARGKGDRVVIHLQDIHGNAEAQGNLSKAVLALAPHVGLVGLEGASKPIDLRKFRTLRLKPAALHAADFLLKEKMISGPVHAAYTGPADMPPFLGIEDATLHQANVDAYRHAAPGLAGKQNALAVLREDVERRKAAEFSNDLRAFDAAVQRHRANQGSLADFLTALVRAAPGAAGANVRCFLKAHSIENSLDFALLEREREQVLEKLLARLSVQEIQSLTDNSLAYRMGGMGHGEYYDELTRLCGKAGVSLAATPAFDAYVRYVLLVDRVSGAGLFEEAAALEAAAYEALGGTERERRLIREDRALHLSEKLIDFRLTPFDWKEYEFLSGSSTLPQVREAEDFYRIAGERDRAMSRNLLTAMETRNARIAALVTGGYHAPGMAEALAAQGVTVISFIPRVDKLEGPEGADYLSVFTRDKTPLENIFQGEKVSLAMDPNRGGPAPYLLTASSAVGMDPGVRSADVAERVLQELKPEGIDFDVHAEREQTTAGGGYAVGFQGTWEGGKVSAVVRCREDGSIESVGPKASPASFKGKNLFRGYIEYLVAWGPRVNSKVAAADLLYLTLIVISAGFSYFMLGDAGFQSGFHGGDDLAGLVLLLLGGVRDGHSVFDPVDEDCFDILEDFRKGIPMEKEDIPLLNEWLKTRREEGRPLVGKLKGDNLQIPVEISLEIFSFQLSPGGMELTVRKNNNGEEIWTDARQVKAAIHAVLLERGGASPVNPDIPVSPINAETPPLPISPKARSPAPEPATPTLSPLISSDRTGSGISSRWSNLTNDDAYEVLGEILLGPEGRHPTNIKLLNEFLSDRQGKGQPIAFSLKSGIQKYALLKLVVNDEREPAQVEIQLGERLFSFDQSETILQILFKCRSELGSKLGKGLEQFHSIQNTISSGKKEIVKKPPKPRNPMGVFANSFDLKAKDWNSVPLDQMNLDPETRILLSNFPLFFPMMLYLTGYRIQGGFEITTPYLPRAFFFNQGVGTLEELDRLTANPEYSLQSIDWSQSKEFSLLGWTVKRRWPKPISPASGEKMVITIRETQAREWAAKQAILGAFAVLDFVTDPAARERAVEIIRRQALLLHNEVGWTSSYLTRMFGPPFWSILPTRNGKADDRPFFNQLKAMQTPPNSTRQNETIYVKQFRNILLRERRTLDRFSTPNAGDTSRLGFPLPILDIQGNRSATLKIIRHEPGESLGDVFQKILNFSGDLAQRLRILQRAIDEFENDPKPETRDELREAFVDFFWGIDWEFAYRRELLSKSKAYETLDTLRSISEFSPEEARKIAELVRGKIRMVDLTHLKRMMEDTAETFRDPFEGAMTPAPSRTNVAPASDPPPRKISGGEFVGILNRFQEKEVSFDPTLVASLNAFLATESRAFLDENGKANTVSSVKYDPQFGLGFAVQPPGRGPPVTQYGDSARKVAAALAASISAPAPPQETGGKAPSLGTRHSVPRASPTAGPSGSIKDKKQSADFAAFFERVLKKQEELRTLASAYSRGTDNRASLENSLRGYLRLFGKKYPLDPLIEEEALGVIDLLRVVNPRNRLTVPFRIESLFTRQNLIYLQLLKDESEVHGANAAASKTLRGLDARSGSPPGTEPSLFESDPPPVVRPLRPGFVFLPRLELWRARMLAGPAPLLVKALANLWYGFFVVVLANWEMVFYLPVIGVAGFLLDPALLNFMPFPHGPAVAILSVAGFSLGLHLLAHLHADPHMSAGDVAQVLAVGAALGLAGAAPFLPADFLPGFVAELTRWVHGGGWVSSGAAPWISALLLNGAVHSGWNAVAVVANSFLSRGNWKFRLRPASVWGPGPTSLTEAEEVLEIVEDWFYALEDPLANPEDLPDEAALARLNAFIEKNGLRYREGATEWKITGFEKMGETFQVYVQTSRIDPVARRGEALKNTLGKVVAELKYRRAPTTPAPGGPSSSSPVRPGDEPAPQPAAAAPPSGPAPTSDEAAIDLLRRLGDPAGAPPVTDERIEDLNRWLSARGGVPGRHGDRACRLLEITRSEPYGIGCRVQVPPLMDVVTLYLAGARSVFSSVRLPDPPVEGVASAAEPALSPPPEASPNPAALSNEAPGTASAEGDARRSISEETRTEKGEPSPPRQAEAMPSSAPPGSFLMEERRALAFLSRLAENPAYPLSVPDALGLWNYCQHHFRALLVIQPDGLKAINLLGDRTVIDPRDMKATLKALVKRKAGSFAPADDTPATGDSPWTDEAALNLLQRLAEDPDLALDEKEAKFLQLYCRMRFQTLLLFKGGRVHYFVNSKGMEIKGFVLRRETFLSLCSHLKSSLRNLSDPRPSAPSAGGAFLNSDAFSGGAFSREREEERGKKSTFADLAKGKGRLKPPREPRSFLHLLTRDWRWGAAGFLAEAAGLGLLAALSLPWFGLGAAALAFAHARTVPDRGAEEWRGHLAVFGLYGLAPFPVAALVHGLYDAFAIHNERKALRAAAAWVAWTAREGASAERPPALGPALLRHLLPPAESFGLNRLDARGVGVTARGRTLFWSGLMKSAPGADPRSLTAALFGLAAGEVVRHRDLPVHISFVGEEDIDVARDMGTEGAALVSANGDPGVVLVFVAGSEAVFAALEPLARQGRIHVLRGGSAGAVDPSAVIRQMPDEVKGPGVLLTVSRSTSLRFLAAGAADDFWTRIKAALEQAPLAPANIEFLLRAARSIAQSA